MTKESELPGKAKVPPNSKESEMMVLGCMLTSINSLNIASERLSDSDFYYSEHKIIFRCLQDAYKADKPADVHLIAEELKRQNKLHLVGGVVYLTTLAQYAGTSAYIEEYTTIVKDKSLLRQMVVSAQHVEKTAFDEPGDVSVALDEAQQLFFHIGQSRTTKAGELIGDILAGKEKEKNTSFLKVLEARQERFMRLGPEDSAITGIPTHFVDIDKMINGLNNSHLLILASRPGMGKTAFSLNIAEGVSFKNRIPVGIFSLEMTAEQLVHRIVCSQSEVESNKILTGSLSASEFHHVVEAVNEIQQHVIVIDDQPGVKITDLRAKARRMKECHNVGLIIIDYLQLIAGSGFSRNAENRQNEISEISRMLKVLARELDVPILCLSQLSRKVEERQGHRPMMSDLRESGCLTGDTRIQDAKTGKIYTIKELAERDIQEPIPVYAVNDDLRIREHKMVKAFYSGKKSVFELKMRSGRTIKASANHPFLLLSGWTPLEKLEIGNRIGTPRSPSDLEKIEQNPNLDIIPKEAWETFIKQAKKEHKLSWREICATLGWSYSGSSLFKSGISRARMAALHKAIPSEKLLRLANSDIYWDEIISIQKVGEEDVYDATVEGAHNFIANDLLVHNSIEQDADIVLFLLRREYYDPYDKPGQAELIIAKNRHGGTGSVTLTYRKEIAQFANFSQDNYQPSTSGPPPSAKISLSEPDYAYEP